jgi:ParB-like chromosome segregation protein Spo0J
MVQGARPFSQPISITRCGVIIDGYARYELARRQGRQTILCLEYDLDEQEALRWLIQNHLPSKGLNGFSRSLLALDLEQPLQEAARANQQEGGRNKGSSKLTEAQAVDVRSETAATACVSSGNVTKAKQVLKSADPMIQQAVKSGEISVHKAWQWSRLSPQEQLKNLEELRSRKGTNQTSRRLIQKHVERMLPTRLIPPKLSDVLKPLIPDRLAMLNSIVVCEIDAPGKIAYITKNALQTLRTREELDE